MAVDALVDGISTYNGRPCWLQGRVAPFGVILTLWVYYWSAVLGTEPGAWELGCIVTAAILILNVLTALFCYWFVSVNCQLNYTQVRDPTAAAWAKVTPTKNNGWTELVPLERTRLPSSVVQLSFTFQKIRYTYDEDRRRFQVLEFDVNRDYGHYQAYKGLESDEAVTETRIEYSANRMEMSIPAFLDLFIERATAPFFVFQVFCVGLWCLEDMWYYSAFTLFMLMTFEATIVKQQLKNMSEIRNMGNKPYQTYVYRSRKWTRISTDELVCGDLISIGRSQEERGVPCDILLLRGSCIVDESMLTGESVPQMKESVEEIERSRLFDFHTDGRLHVVYGGTNVVQHTPPPKQEAGLKAPDNGCLGYVLRTGFNTSQGQLLRTIMFGVKRVTANNSETFAFILFLLVFAVAAAAYLWIKGSQDESRSKYKLFLECSLILTSVIPPELPIELSLAVNNSLIALQKLGIFCTEAFRIPFAGKIDICCFDKTGTLTTDNLVVEGVAGLRRATNGNDDDSEADATMEVIKSPLDLPDSAPVRVLAACQSLMRLDEELIGDPLEKACLEWIDWTLTKQEAVMPKAKSSKVPPLKIFRRFHFTSQMKRMTVVAGHSNRPPLSTAETYHIAVVKGAPETLKAMYDGVPSHYERTYQKLAQEGARVLALGIRELGQLSSQEIRDSPRETFEQGLIFAGFVVIRCPLKPDTKMLIREITDSSHKVAIITGDNPLTACHVASVLRFVGKHKEVLILDESHDTSYTPSAATNSTAYHLRSVGGELAIPLDAFVTEFDSAKGRKEFLTKHDLCLTGAGLEHLWGVERRFVTKLLPSVRVFARMSPKQKEMVINELKAAGHTTLMCGDGTNDVGALKHSDVGVALLSHPYDASKAEEAKREKDTSSAQPPATPALPPGEKNGEIGASPVNNKAAARAMARRSDAPPGSRMARSAPNPNSFQAKLEQMRRDMEEQEKANVIRLGDASIAAPFTSKFTSIQSICHVIKQGRCTLVTTLQMFKILALNALVLAYSQSALYLDGVKFSDTQATIQGVLLAACFLFISRSRPLKFLAKQRPIPNIFNAYTLLTVTLQFAVHFACMVFIVQRVHELEPRTGKIDLEESFKPNLLNTAVYIMSMALQVSTFAVNYRGRPFMESLVENRPMLISVMGAGLAVFALASNMIPEMSEKFELVPNIPEQFRNVLVSCVIADLLLCYIIDRVLNFALGDMRAR